MDAFLGKVRYFPAEHSFPRSRAQMQTDHFSCDELCYSVCLGSCYSSWFRVLYWLNGRTGVGITASYAIRQTSRLLKVRQQLSHLTISWLNFQTVDDNADYRELQELQERLNSKIQVCPFHAQLQLHSLTLYPDYHTSYWHGRDYVFVPRTWLWRSQLTLLDQQEETLP